MMRPFSDVFERLLWHAVYVGAEAGEAYKIASGNRTGGPRWQSRDIACAAVLEYRGGTRPRDVEIYPLADRMFDEMAGRRGGGGR
jgi:hypothetical protein